MRPDQLAVDRGLTLFERWASLTWVCRWNCPCKREPKQCKTVDDRFCPIELDNIALTRYTYGR